MLGLLLLLLPTVAPLNSLDQGYIHANLVKLQSKHKYTLLLLACTMCLLSLTDHMLEVLSANCKEDHNESDVL